MKTSSSSRCLRVSEHDIHPALKSLLFFFFCLLLLHIHKNESKGKERERRGHKISKQKRQSHVGFCVLKEQLKNIRVKVTISHIAAETSDLLREEDTTRERGRANRGKLVGGLQLEDLGNIFPKLNWETLWRLTDSLEPVESAQTSRLVSRQVASSLVHFKLKSGLPCLLPSVPSRLTVYIQY